MKKDRAFPFRVGFTVAVIILDFFIIPQVLSILIHLKQGNPTGFHWSILGGITAIPMVRDIWLWLQPAALGTIAWIWLTGRSLVNVVYDDDQPRAAGHGQHGTARWLSENEVDRKFSTHRF